MLGAVILVGAALEVLDLFTGFIPGAPLLRESSRTALCVMSVASFVHK